MAAKRPAMTKSPLKLAKQAFDTASEVLPPYSDMRSRHDFTQSQLTDYRGIIQILADSSDLRNILTLKKLPHYTTVQKAQNRMSFGFLPDGSHRIIKNS